jgi:hypothetical protein
MKALIAAAVLAALALPALVLPAAAQQQQQQTCKPRDEIVKVIGEKNAESRRAYGLASPTQMIEMYANAETGTRTALVTGPDGVSSMVASGNAWTEVEEAPGGGSGA